MKLLFTLSAASLLLSGCIQYRAPVYQPSASTLLHLQSLNGQQVQLGEVSRLPGQVDTKHCRTQGQVKTSGGDYAAYVERALREELGLAGLLNAQAETSITATLDRMAFSSWRNSWDMQLTLHSSNGHSYTTQSRYRGHAASLEDDAACHLAAQALPSAVRQLLHDALTHTDFAALL